MNMFAKERFLGVDFGTESIKAVELELRAGQPFLVNYGEVPLLTPYDSKKPATRSFHEDMAVKFKALLERMQPETNQICISMPSFLGLISLIEFPEMTDSELEEAVRFEARKYIPSALEDVSLSWESLGTKDAVGTASEKDAKNRKTEVLLVAALNKDVWQYEGYVSSVGYEMKLLELETFSIIRSVVGSDLGTFLVIDIGARAANVILVENGYVKKSRSIDAGGRDITRALSESLNISVDRADTLKKSTKDFLNAKDVAVIFPAIETIINESGRMVESWKTTRLDGKIDSVILSGGTGHMTGLPQYLSKKLGLPVKLSDPWRTISYLPILQPKIALIGASFSAAIGLALYAIADAEKKKQS